MLWVRPALTDQGVWGYEITPRGTVSLTKNKYVGYTYDAYKNRLYALNYNFVIDTFLGNYVFWVFAQDVYPPTYKSSIILHHNLLLYR